MRYFSAEVTVKKFGFACYADSEEEARAAFEGRFWSLMNEIPHFVMPEMAITGTDEEPKCPKCGSVDQECQSEAQDYFRCKACGHEWEVY